MALEVTQALQTKCKTCFRGPRMVFHAHFKKYFITLGVWFLMYPRRPPPPVWSKTRVFPVFLLLPSLTSFEKKKPQKTKCQILGFSKPYPSLTRIFMNNIIVLINIISAKFAIYSVYISCKSVNASSHHHFAFTDNSNYL